MHAKQIRSVGLQPRMRNGNEACLICLMKRLANWFRLSTLRISYVDIVTTVFVSRVSICNGDLLNSARFTRFIDKQLFAPTKTKPEVAKGDCARLDAPKTNFCSQLCFLPLGEETISEYLIKRPISIVVRSR